MTNADAETLNRQTRLSVALVAVFIATYATVLYLQAGLLVVHGSLRQRCFDSGTSAPNERRITAALRETIFAA